MTFGLLVAVAGRSLGITEETVSNAGAVLMIGFGLVLLVPRFSESFATATAGFSERADAQIDSADRSGAYRSIRGGRFAWRGLVALHWPHAGRCDLVGQPGGKLGPCDCPLW